MTCRNQLTTPAVQHIFNTTDLPQSSIRLVPIITELRVKWAQYQLPTSRWYRGRDPVRGPHV